ncbi:uncharacterized protein [Branchiostoma lanceolatum]|uniref:uncharacterized protein n=1 Tax=Branchiostoma lanceolatum TaxID=7740 RepID=UPI0034569269
MMEASTSALEPKPPDSELESEETQPKPLDVEPKPPDSELKSEETQPKPPDYKLKSEETQPKPPDTEPESEETQPKPLDVEPKPTYSKLESEETQPKPLDVEPKPPETELESEETQPKPPDYKLESEETQPKPLDVEPKPPESELESEETQPKPTDSELESEETQPKPLDVEPKPPESELESEETQPKPTDSELESEETQPKQQQRRPPKDILNSCRTYIIDNIGPALDHPILNQLLQDNVIQQGMYKDIKSIRSLNHRATRLVDTLCTLDTHAYDLFKKALKTAGYSHIVEKMDEAEKRSSSSQVIQTITPLSSNGAIQNDQSSLTEDTSQPQTDLTHTNSNTVQSVGRRPININIHVQHADNVNIHEDLAASLPGLNELISSDGTKLCRSISMDIKHKDSNECRSPLDERRRMSFPEGSDKDKLTSSVSQDQPLEETCVLGATGGHQTSDVESSVSSVLPEDRKPVNILLVGGKRTGKSETGNTLLKTKAFRVTRKGGTEKYEKCTMIISDDGVKRTITVVDTPGLSDKPNQSELDEIKKGVNMLSSGVDAVVLVWDDRSDGNADKEVAVFQSLQQMFGYDLYQHLVIIVTHMEEGGISEFVEELPDPMKGIVQSCGNRIVAFDNKARDDKIQCHQTEQFFSATGQLPTQKLHERHQAFRINTQRDHNPPTYDKPQTTISTEDINLLLIGCKGNGKSSTANTIFGEDVFVVSEGGTEESQREKTSYKPPWHDELEVLFRVTDTPGVSEEMTGSEFDQLDKAMQMNPEGFDAIILVWPDRMSPNIAKMEKKAFESLHRMFGDTLFDHLLIAVTGTKHDSIPKYCHKLPESMKSIQQKSQGIIGFDNEYKRATCHKKPIHQLIMTAKDINRNHGRYTKDHLYPTCRINPGEELRVALIGKTGSGKSSTANMIVGSKEFTVTCSASSETKTCTYRSRQKGDRKIAVVDTPGICDTDNDPREVVEEICKMATILSDGLHALLLVVTLSRFTKEEVEAIDMLKELFGKEFMKYVAIVLTHKDEVDEDPKFVGDVKKYIEAAPQTFKDLLNDCKGRYVAVNNKTEDETLKREQLATLVNLITNTIGKQAGNPFKDAIFEEGQREKERIKEEIVQRDDYGFQNRPLVRAVKYIRRLNPNPDDAERGISPNPDEAHGQKQATKPAAILPEKVRSMETAPGETQKVTSQDADGLYMIQDHFQATDDEDVVVMVSLTEQEGELEGELEEMARKTVTDRSFQNTSLFKMIWDRLKGVKSFFARMFDYLNPWSQGNENLKENV